MFKRVVLLVVLLIALASVAFAEGTVVSQTDSQSGETEITYVRVGVSNYRAGGAAFAEGGSSGFAQGLIESWHASIVQNLLGTDYTYVREDQEINVGAAVYDSTLGQWVSTASWTAEITYLVEGLGGDPPL